jgi:carbonic anhydrase
LGLGAWTALAAYFTVPGPGWLGFVTGAAAIGSGLLACNLNVESAHARQLSQERREKMTADDIIDVMKKGNERFRKGESRPRNFLAEQRASAKGQYPAAVVLSCIDSRTPAEIILDVGIGDIFNARVAGNVANEDILGSLEFACKVAGAKVILVMGHTSYGAIKGSIDNVELGNLTGLLAKMRPAVKATAYEGKRTSKELAFVDAVARKNVEATMAHIREKSSALRELEATKNIKIAGSMYNLETAAVEFFG